MDEKQICCLCKYSSVDPDMVPHNHYLLCSKLEYPCNEVFADDRCHLVPGELRPRTFIEDFCQSYQNDA